VHDLAARVLARQAVAGAWIALFLPAIAIVLWTRWMTVSLGLSPGLLEHPPSCNTLDLTMLTAFGIFLPWYFALAAAGVCGISKIPSALMLGLSCLLFLFFAPLGASTFMSGVGSWSVTDPVGLMLLAPAAVLAFFPVLGEHHARIQLARPRRTTVTLGFLVFVATGVIGSVFLLNQYWGGTSETRFYRLLLAAAALTYVGLHHVVICLLMIPAARHCRLVRDFLEREGEGVLREAYAKAKCDLDEAQHGLLRRIIDSYGKYPIWFRPNFIVFIGTPVFISILLWAMKAEPPYQDMARGLLGVTQELAAALETPGQPDISESIRLTVGDTATYAELLRDYLSQDRDDGTRSEHFRRVLGRHVPALAHDLESWNRALRLWVATSNRSSRLMRGTYVHFSIA